MSEELRTSYKGLSKHYIKITNYNELSEVIYNKLDKSV